MSNTTPTPTTTPAVWVEFHTDTHPCATPFQINLSTGVIVDGITAAPYPLSDDTPAFLTSPGMNTVTVGYLRSLI